MDKAERDRLRKQIERMPFPGEGVRRLDAVAVLTLLDTLDATEAERDADRVGAARLRAALLGIAEMTEEQGDAASRDVLASRVLLAKVMMLAHTGLGDLSEWVKGL